MSPGKIMIRNEICFYTALLTAVYFAITASAWRFLMNLVISLPVGLISFLFWTIGKNRDVKKKRYKVIPVIWIVGILVSVAVLIYLLLSE
jgi:hypothetical protein